MVSLFSDIERVRRNSDSDLPALGRRSVDHAAQHNKARLGGGDVVDGPRPKSAQSYQSSDDIEEVVRRKREELNRVNQSIVKQPSIGGSSSDEETIDPAEDTLELEKRR